jgi:hypothetical protein
MLLVHPALALVAAIAVQTIGVITTQHPTTIPKGTRIACVLGTTLDSSTVQQGDTFVLQVNDPSQPALRGAEIDGYIDQVSAANAINPRRIGFLLQKIKFPSGTSEPIRAYVLSNRVTQRTEGQSTPQPEAMRPPGQSSAFAPNPSTIAFQARIGPKPTNNAGTGGYVYASGKPMHVAAGTAVTIELAGDLKTP